MTFLVPLLLLLQDPVSVERLIEDLRSDQVERRTRAELELKLRGEAAVAAVEPLLKDGDAELAARARAILGGIALLRNVTPNLERIMPGVRARLASGRLAAWTETLLEAAGKPGVTRDDLSGLAPLAVRGAAKADRPAVCSAIAGGRLSAAAPELVPWLDESDWNLRQPVFEALETCRARELAPVLLERVRREPRDKQGWLRLMANMGCREAIPDLIAQYPDPLLLSRLDAVEAVPALLRNLREGTEAHGLITALEIIAPDEILPALVAHLGDEDERVRKRAMHTLTSSALFPAALPHLTKLLESPDPSIRAQALSAIGNLRLPDSLPEIRRRLEDPSAPVRRAAATSLASLGHRDGLPELLLMLRHPQFRIGAAYSLAHLQVKEAIPDLLPLLGEAEGKQHLAEALALLGAQEVRPHLEKLLEHSDPHVRSSTAYSLVVLDGARALPSLRKLMRDGDANVRWAAFRQVGQLDTQDALAVVREWASHADPYDRNQAYWLLSILSPREAIPLLLKELDQPESHVGWSAAEYLGRLNATEALPKLRALHARAPHAHARRAVGTALAWMNERDGVRELVFSAEHPFQQFVLNALRRPDVWRAWRAKTLEGPPLCGSSREVVEGLARRAGLALEWPADARTSVGGDQRLRVDRLDLLSAFNEIRWSLPAAVLEPDRVRFLRPREARRFWLRWWGEECLKSDREDDRAEGRGVLAELEDSENRRKELSLKRAALAPSVHLTPGLKSILGLEERLARGNDEAWTRAFLDAAEPYRKPEYAHLKNPDFDALAPRALQGSFRPDELEKILQVCSQRKLKGARPSAEHLLTHAAAKVRVESARVILTLDGASSLPRILPMLDDADGEVRKGIVGVLGALRMVQAIPEIMARKADPSIRAGLLGAAAPLEIEEALPILIQAATRTPEDAYHVRMTTLFQIHALGGPQLNGEIRTLLRTEDHPNAVQSLLRSAGEWGAREAVPEIIDLVAKPRRMGEMYQDDAFRTLARLGAREAAPLILDHLKPGRFRRGAAQAAADLGLAEAAPALRALLEGDRAETVGHAAQALGALGDRPCLDRLRTLLLHPDLPARTGAAHGLAFLRDRDSYGRILEICQDPKNYSGEPRRILALLRTPEALKLLAKDLSYPDDRMLEAIGSAGKSLLPLVSPRLSHQDVWTRHSALQAVGRMEGDEALAEVRRMMSDEADPVREAAAQILCRRGLREGATYALEHSNRMYYPLPFELNGVRERAGWEKLKAARITGPFYGSARDLVIRLAADSGLKLEDLPPDSPVRPAWTNVHVAIHEADTPLDGLQAVARLSQTQWMMILEPDRIRIVARKEAKRFWKEWWEKEGK